MAEYPVRVRIYRDWVLIVDRENGFGNHGKFALYTTFLKLVIKCLFEIYTVYPRSSYPSDIVSYHIKLVTTPWTDSILYLI